MAVIWEKAQQAFLTLWDIDREFQNAHEAYEQWQARNRRKRSSWACLGVKNYEDALGKALSLGREVQRVMERGADLYGSRFEQGDSTCHTILNAQLLRVQYEVRQTLYDTALHTTRISLPHDDLITTAKSIRRTVLHALEDQIARFDSREFVPMLPPPRFKVDYCPFADQLRNDLKATKSSNLRARKLRPEHRHDDRELCPHCDACISVTSHSGLPAYRGILFTSHVARDPLAKDDQTTFACNSCYKTFTDSYAFLDHIFQKQIGSNRSCLKRTSSHFTLYQKEYMESDPSIVKQCLKNCLKRELNRVRNEKTKSTIRVVQSDIHPSMRSSTTTI
ncbi:hypothetical protein HBI62_116590 [Parastagonospora nodorum]|nr:hypothetical protein HBI62_116590 [Parastagonospora nodorum]KAH6141498.1 hypothetical protein HBI63_200850 [Parastagonospora nodorum]KAH6179802.1 hypothetical protein HBI61_100780 [Parastagonospora nodorum]